MPVYGLHAQVQALRDLLRRAPFRDELQNLALPWSQPTSLAGHLGAPHQVLCDDWLGDAWTEVEVTPRYGTDGELELGRARRLEHVARDPCLQSAHHVRLVRMHREHQDSHARILTRHLRGGV